MFFLKKIISKAFISVFFSTIQPEPRFKILETGQVLHCHLVIFGLIFAECFSDPSHTILMSLHMREHLRV